MTDSSDKPISDDEKKRQRERVERLLLKAQQTSTGSVSVGGKRCTTAPARASCPLLRTCRTVTKASPMLRCF